MRPGDFVFAFEETGKNEAYLRIVLPLAEALRIAFPERRVIVRRIPSHGFAQTVKAERIPFVISTAGSMVSLPRRRLAVSSLSTRNARNWEASRA